MASMTGRSSCTNNLLWPFVSKPAALEQFMCARGVYSFSALLSALVPLASLTAVCLLSRGSAKIANWPQL
jgi:hypothetical protein